MAKSISYRRVVGREKKHARHRTYSISKFLPSVLAQESVTPYIAMLVRADWVCPVVRCSWKRGRMVGRRNRSRSTRNRPVTGECIASKRLGNQAGLALVELLFNDPEVTKIQTDPSPSNLRAIRCYEKAGFERQGTVTNDGPAVYMVQTRRAFERTRSVA